MKFGIRNNGKSIEVKLTFRCGYAGNYIYTFEHNAGAKSHAGILAETIYEQFTDHIKQIRKAAYNEGWGDKTKRRTKRTDFDWCPNIINMKRYD